jgi:hypothetical protein
VAGHVVRIMERRNSVKILLQSLKERPNSKELWVKERIILKWILGT